MQAASPGVVAQKCTSLIKSESWMLSRLLKNTDGSGGISQHVPFVLRMEWGVTVRECTGVLKGPSDLQHQGAHLGRRL